MQDKTLEREVSAAIRRLEQEDPGIRQLLDDSHAYAIFPSVGKAALVVGGAYGHGLVFEKGKPIGHATIAQTTIGVQIGGDTFTEVVAFDSKESLERFKEGKVVFAANASAVLVKAGATGTADYEDGVCALAYSQGGMLLEAAIGGQKFNFKPMDEDQQSSSGGSGSSSRGGSGSSSRGKSRSGRSGSGSRSAGKTRSAQSRSGKKTKARRTPGKTTTRAKRSKSSARASGRKRTKAKSRRR
jgi:hypothetical protein